MINTDNARMAAQLSTILNVPITPLEDSYGFRVKGTDTHWIDIVRKVFNWRLILVDKEDEYSQSAGFCYYGNDVIALLRALGAALEWDGTGQPQDWDKDVATGLYNVEENRVQA